MESYANGVVTVIVGLVALLVYWLRKRSEKQNAAIVIVMDIRHAEQVVLSILEKGSIDRTLKKIITENNWAKYKHLFAGDFSIDDFSAFNRFFDACVEISEARMRMMSIFDENLKAKAAIAQQLVISLESSDSDDDKKKRSDLIRKIESEIYTFEPGEPQNRILHNLQLMGRLSNTIAFEKLKKAAGIDA